MGVESRHADVATSSPAVRVVDAHQHYGHLDTSFSGTGEDVAGLSPAEFAEQEISHRLEALDRHGIDQAVILASHAYLRPRGLPDTRRVNNELVDYCAAHPDRFLAAVGVVEPLYGHRGLAEIRRCFEELGMRALTFHTKHQGVSVDSPWVRRYVERMGDYGMVAYIHALAESTEEALWKVDRLAGAVPDVTLIVANAFSSLEQPRFALVVAERRQNTFWETGIVHSFELVMPMVRKLGAHRVIFGSDLHSWPVRVWSDHLLREIRAFELSEADKRAILGDNIVQLLGVGR